MEQTRLGLYDSTFLYNCRLNNGGTELVSSAELAYMEGSSFPVELFVVMGYFPICYHRLFYHDLHFMIFPLYSAPLLTICCWISFAKSLLSLKWAGKCFTAAEKQKLIPSKCKNLASFVNREFFFRKHFFFMLIVIEKWRAKYACILLQACDVGCKRVREVGAVGELSKIVGRFYRVWIDLAGLHLGHPSLE